MSSYCWFRLYIEKCTSLFMCICHIIVSYPAHYSPDFCPKFHCLHSVFFCLCPPCHCAMPTLVCICVSTFNTSLCHMFVHFFSASATCVVAMFLCLYISEHLLFQQGPYGLKCQSKQLPDKCIVHQACVSPPPIPALVL